VFLKSGIHVSVELAANHIFGPSSVSMESTLRYYGLIPEHVFTVQSMTMKHSRTFSNDLGRFKYRQCSDDYFPIGIRQDVMAKTAFPIATPEKALCNLIL
jgi:hypothetical protein